MAYYDRAKTSAVSQAANQAISDLKKDKLWPVYYLYGEEPYKIHEFVKQFTQIFLGSDVRSTEKFDANEISIEELSEAVQTKGLFSSGKRIILVQNAQVIKEYSWIREDDTDQDTALILLADSIDQRKKFHQHLRKKGYAIEFKTVKAAELSQWVQYIAKKENILLSNESIEFLAMSSQGSLIQMAQDIQKIALYFDVAAKPLQSPLGLDEIQKIVTNRYSMQMFDLVEALLSSKKARALMLSESLIRAPEDALGFVGFVTWALQNPERFSGPAQNIARNKKPQLVEALLDLDERIKSSGVPAKLLIDSFIAEQSATSNF
ncbi:MAG: DNA polymerase III subunit delta [Bacteriovoracia bacterium]